MKLDYKERKEFKDYHEERRLERRVSWMKYCTAVLFVLFLLDFWYLQIIRGKEFFDQADDNRIRKIILKPRRGVLSDRNDNVIATSKPSFSILINREQKDKIAKSIDDVSPLLGLDAKEVLARAEKMRKRPDTEPLIVKEDVSFEEVARVAAKLDTLTNVVIEEGFKRFYELKEIAHVAGYIGEVSESQIQQEKEKDSLCAIASGDIVGKAGIEKQYDQELRGTKGIKEIEVDSMGRELKEIATEQEPQQGDELELSIDSRLQKALVEAFDGEIGAGVFMDPQTGEVLALVSTPLYDPNDFAGRLLSQKWRDLTTDPNHPMLNRAVQATYPPGSTFKVLIALAALERGVIDERTTFYCSGSARLYGRSYSCWKRGGHGTMNLHQALVHSCNVYFYNVGTRLDIDDIKKCASEFGFGKITDIDLTFESEGLVPSSEWKKNVMKEDWFPGETLSVSIGQGPLHVTPLQMAVFISEIANGGKRVTPRIVRKEERQEDEQPLHINKDNIKLIRDALRGVVNDEGTGWRAKLDGVVVCGKTGTAQISSRTADKDTRKLPKEEKEHAWFIGFAPYDNPEISFAIIVEHGGFGGETAAPIAKKVLEVYFGSDQERPGMLDVRSAQLKKKDAHETVSEN